MARILIFGIYGTSLYSLITDSLVIHTNSFTRYFIIHSHNMCVSVYVLYFLLTFYYQHTT